MPGGRHSPSPLSSPQPDAVPRPLLAALASALLPGSGQWANGRRRRALPLFTVSAAGLVLTGLATWLAVAKGPLYVLEQAVQPGTLATLFALNVLFLLVRAWAATDAYQLASPTSGRGAVVVGAALVGALIVVPHVLIGAQVAMAHEMTTSVFQPDVSEAPGEEALTGPAWEPGDRLTVLLLSKQGRARTTGAVVVTVVPGEQRMAVLTFPRKLIHLPTPPQAGEMAGEGSLTALYRFGRSHAALYPGTPDSGAALVKDAVQTLLGIRVHHVVVVDARGLGELEAAVGGAVTGRPACAAAAMIHRIDPASLVPRLPALAAAVRRHVSTDIPLDRLPDVLELLPAISPDRVVSVPLRAPRFGSTDGTTQVLDPDLVRAAVVNLIRLAPSEAAAKLGAIAPARCADPATLEASPPG